MVPYDQILKSAGIGEKDRQRIIAGLMELTGTTEMAEKALQMLKGVNFFEEGKCFHNKLNQIWAKYDTKPMTIVLPKATDLFKFLGQNMPNSIGVGGPILKATERTLQAFFALEDSLDRKQRTQCNKLGYTYARKAQIEKLLKDQGELTGLKRDRERDAYLWNFTKRGTVYLFKRIIGHQ